MTPPIFPLCSADTTLQGLLSDGAGRFQLYPFGEAPQQGDRPYATWQVVGGEPENYLGNAPDVDAITVQLDVFALSGDAARNIARALRSVLEDVAHVVRYNGEWREPETRLYRVSFTIDWLVDR